MFIGTAQLELIDAYLRRVEDSSIGHPHAGQAWYRHADHRGMAAAAKAPAARKPSSAKLAREPRTNVTR
jgi:hypothetical protein